MADNIKIVGQVLDTSRINRYNVQDEQLLLPIVQQETFGKPEDYVEYFVFDLGGNVLNSNYNYNSYKLPSNYGYSQSYLPTLEIDPIQDIENLGYESGEVTSRYNFFRKVSGEPFSSQLFISQISSDRTELRVGSTELDDIALIDIASNFADNQLAVPYYYYIMLNFGNNNQVIAVNVLSELNALGSTTTIDLYKRNTSEKTEEQMVTASKWFTFLWGIVAIAVACVANLAENLIQLVNIIGSIFYGNVLGIFLIAFFFKYVKGHAVFMAAIITQIIVIALFLLNEYAYINLPFLWLNFVGCIIVITIASILQLLFKNDKTITT